MSHTPTRVRHQCKGCGKQLCRSGYCTACRHARRASGMYRNRPSRIPSRTRFSDIAANLGSNRILASGSFGECVKAVASTLQEAQQS